ncbi:MAG: hypothetical protein EXS46_02865 [Candidatus Taylorbacteria bacterium]|nr:hypothetical protein [Candidatus Taylorbacteria bacterium]
MKETFDINDLPLQKIPTPKQNIEAFAESEALQLSKLLEEKVNLLTSEATQKMAKYVALFSMASLMAVSSNDPIRELPETRATIEKARREFGNLSHPTKSDTRN